MLAKPKYKEVIVVGMHRSGTSMVANMLHQAGIGMGTSFAKVKSSNVDGHYEDQNIIAINNELLRQLDGSWDKPPRSQQIDSIKSDISQKYRSYVSARGEKTWGVKDPRLTLFLDYFDAELDSPFYVYCTRDEDDVANSIQVRDGIDLMQAKKIKHHYDDVALKFLNCRSNWIEVQFSKLQADSGKELRKILEKLDAELSDSQISNTAVFKNRAQLKKSKLLLLCREVGRSVVHGARNPKLISKDKVVRRILKWHRQIQALLRK